MSLIPAHIVYLHQYFRWPEIGGPCRSYHLAKGLAERGYRVTLITGKLPNKLPDSSEEWGFDVIELDVTYNTNAGIGGRLKSFSSFSLKSLLLIRTLRPDLVYASSTPSSVGLTALLSLRPYIFEMRDLWPEVPIEMGYVKSDIISFMLKSVQQLVYRQARAVVGLNAAMELYVLPYNAAFHYVPNFAQAVLVPEFEQLHQIRLQQLTTKPIKVFYGGAIGPANDPDRIAEFAVLLHHAGHQLILAPEPERSLPPIIAKLVDQGIIQNVGFLTPDQLTTVLADCHFNLVSFAQHESLKLTSPNKWFTANANGLPSLAFLDNPLYGHQKGTFVASSPHDLVKYVLEIKPDMYRRMAYQAYKQSYNIHEANHEVQLLINAIMTKLS